MKQEELEKSLFDQCIKIIKSKNDNKQSFGNIIHKNKKEVRFDHMTDAKGLNLMHIIVLEGRVDFLQCLLDVGAFDDLIGQKVHSKKCKYEGNTPLDIANYHKMEKVKQEIARLQKLEDSLNMMQKKARLGEAAAVKLLIETHLNMMESPARDGSTALMWAVISGDLQTVKNLIENGANTEIMTYDMETLLGRATIMAYRDIIRFLITEKYSEPNKPCKGQELPVTIAINNADLDTLEVLVDCGATMSNTCLPVVSSKGKIKLWSYVCKLLPNININMKDNLGKTALYRACEGGHIDIIDDIIKKGASLSEVDKHKRTIIFAAIESGKKHVLKHIIKLMKQQNVLNDLINCADAYVGLERKFLVSGRDDGILGYHFVEIHRVYLARFKKAIKSGGQCDVAKYGVVFKSGWGMPTTEDREEVERRYDLALQEPAADSIPDMTALHYALIKEQPEMAVMLINEGIAVDTPDKFGNRPAHLAAMRDYVEILVALENKKAQFDICQDFGMTPEHVAEANKQSKAFYFFEGKKYISDKEVKEWRKRMKKLLNDIEDSKLQKQRRSGMNVKNVIIDACRNLQFEMNRMLNHLGSTSIQQPAT